MSISFLKRLAERATGKQQAIQIKPALTPDMIPEAFHMPEGTLPAYPIQLGEAHANKSQDIHLNLPLHKQAKTDFATVQPNPENFTKTTVKENIPSSIVHTKSDILNRTENGYVQKNISQSRAMLDEAAFPSETTLQKATEKALSNTENSSLDVNSFPKSQERKVMSAPPSENEPAELQGEVPEQTGYIPEAAQDIRLSAKEISDRQLGISIVAKRIFTSTNLEKKDTTKSEDDSSKAPFERKTNNLFKAEEKNESNDYAQRLHEQSAESAFEISGQQESPHVKLNSVSLKPYSNIEAAESWPRPQKQTENIVTIHIGRIEVHAAKDREQPTNPPRSPVLSLNDYLKQRSEEK